MKRVILITGTPCTGKTTTAKQLAQKLNAQYINLTDYAKTTRLNARRRQTTQNHHNQRKSHATKTRRNHQTHRKADIIIDGHYAAAVTPPNLATHVFVLRRNPKELKQFMEKCGFEGAQTLGKPLSRNPRLMPDRSPPNATGQSLRTRRDGKNR